MPGGIEVDIVEVPANNWIQTSMERRGGQVTHIVAFETTKSYADSHARCRVLESPERFLDLLPVLQAVSDGMTSACMEGAVPKPESDPK